MAQLRIEKADVILLNCAFWTVNPTQPWIEAAAIKREKIAYRKELT